MKFLKTSRSIVFYLLVFLLSTSLVAQKNKSTKENYKQRLVNTMYTYSTNYDTGYVKLRDGTLLSGEISLAGDSYNNLSVVRIRTNGGKKYVFYLRSLSEFGLTNSLTNDTPHLFKWITENEKSLFTGFQDVRTGSTDFGYVKTKSGKTHEGKLSIKEANGRIEHIIVKDYNKKNIKIDAEQISNFGAKNYVDEKFDGVYSMVKWRSSGGSGMLANTKSVPIKGVLTLNNGQQKKGYITLVKKDENITRVFVSASPKSKREKFKYNDVKSYTMEQYMKDYYESLKADGEVFEEIHPARKFHQGALALLDGTTLEGLVAKEANSDFCDIFFLENENALVKGYAAAEVERAVQLIPEKTIADHKAMIYNRDHVKGYKIQQPPEWKYKDKSDMSYETKFQPGYLKFHDGNVKVGALSVEKSNGTVKYYLKEGDNKEKYKWKEVKEYGLIVQEARTAFNQKLFKSNSIGFVKLIGSDEIIKGSIKLKLAYDEWDSKMGGYTPAYIKVNDEKYDLANVETYGLINVPLEDFNRGRVINYKNPKLNFNPGSFTNNGTKKEGWIAWARPNDAGEYDTFYFADSLEGFVNVYQTSEGASDVAQNITIDAGDYDPEKDSYFAKYNPANEEKHDGYVITSQGEKIEGQIQLSFPNKLWYATDVLLTTADGTQTHYANDGSLKNVIVTIDGSKKEFVNYENEYAEVLHRDGDLVHFRNPHPTTQSFLGDIASIAAGVAMNQINKEMQTASLLSDHISSDSGFYTTDGRRADFTKEQNVTIYAKEYMILNEVSRRHTMYIPKSYFRQLDAELKGCVEYLIMRSEEKEGLKKMQNPLQTLKFINVSMNN